MKILVTGGAGFIGSHVVDAYLRAGHRVVVVDNLSTGSRKNLDPRAKFYRADVRSLTAIKKIFKKERPRVVSHYAALVHVAESMRNPIPTFNVNVLGTINVLVAFRESKEKRKKIIFASSGGSIYGNPKLLPVKENAAPNPLSPYALSKLMGEEAVRFHGTVDKLDYTILRYANVYGSRQKAGVVSVFASLMRREKRPTIFGDGSKTRDYVHVSDVARATLKALSKGNREIYNIGSGKNTSDQEVFEEVAKNLGFKQSPVYAPRREGEVEHITLDANRARKALGWIPKVSLSKGILEAITR
ncbi:SDR family NAD(P)-dependent oxidoreductase [Candidatus Parcubacteria bacterium]|nr:MAG: SDR family NAD(P)-dependent oxidoreductase [Candidatus Parcubacteria bacterium]